MILLAGVLKHEGRQALAFICIWAMIVFFSVSVYAVQNPDAQSSNLQSLNKKNSAIKQEESQLQTLLQEELPQEKQKDNNPLVEKKVEKKNFSFLSGQTFSNTAANSKKNDAASNTDALSVSLGLIFILIMIFSLAWFMKKMGYTNLTGQGQLKIIATLNLGQKEKIALIQVGQQQLLVGMTATQINTLHVLDELLEETEAQTKDQGVVTGNNPFANKLSKFLNNTQKNIK